MSLIGIIGIAIFGIAMAIAVYEDHKIRKHIDANTETGDKTNTFLSKGWQYVFKQSGKRLVAALGLVIFLITSFFFMRPHIWAAFIGNSDAPVAVGEAGDESDGFNDAFKSNYRKSAESGCVQSASKTIESRKDLSTDQKKEGLVLTKKMCACVAQRSVETLSVAELMELSAHALGGSLSTKINEIRTECLDSVSSSSATTNDLAAHETGLTISQSWQDVGTENSPALSQSEEGNHDPLSIRYTPMYSACMDTGDASQGITSAIVDCLIREIEVQDAILNATYKSVMASLEPTARPSLVSASRSWIRFRDDKCDSENQSGGTEDHILYADCILRMTVQRTIELERMTPQ